MAMLSIGDPIRIGAGIPFPNYRFTRIIGYNAADASTLPSGWTLNRFGGGVGGCTPNIVKAWSSRHALRVVNTPPAGGTNDLYSPPTRGGVLPNFSVAGRQLRVRLLFEFIKTGNTSNIVTPMIAFYNRLETNVFYMTFSATGQSASWSLYDGTAIADMSSPTLTGLGWADPYIDHAYLIFRMGGNSLVATFTVDSVAAMWSLTDPDSATGYDQMETRADIDGLEFYEDDLGRFDRSRDGFSAWQDMTGGQHPRRLSAKFGQLTEADVKLLTLARDLNRGVYSAATGIAADIIIPTAATPIVAEIPYWRQDESQGLRPYFMYGNIVEAPRWKWPHGFLLGRNGAAFELEEPEA